MSDQAVRSRYAETDSQRYLWHLQQLRRKKRARRREDVEPPEPVIPDTVIRQRDDRLIAQRDGKLIEVRT